MQILCFETTTIEVSGAHLLRHCHGHLDDRNLADETIKPRFHGYNVFSLTTLERELGPGEPNRAEVESRVET